MPNWRVWPFALVAAAVCIVGARGQNLDEGKSGPQLFALDCVACHRSPQGLAKNHSGWSLTSFLRQHYTSSSGSAGILAAYLTSGANTRADQKKGKADERQAKQTSPRDQARATPPAAVEQPPGQVPAQTPARKQKEAARPGEPAAELPTRANRKMRRGPEAADPVPMPPPEPTASVAGAPPAGAAGLAAAAQTAAAAVPPSQQPGFGDPLP